MRAIDPVHPGGLRVAVLKVGLPDLLAVAAGQGLDLVRVKAGVLRIVRKQGHGLTPLLVELLLVLGKKARLGLRAEIGPELRHLGNAQTNREYGRGLLLVREGREVDRLGGLALLEILHALVHRHKRLLRELEGGDELSGFKDDPAVGILLDVVVVVLGPTEGNTLLRVDPGVILFDRCLGGRYMKRTARKSCPKK